MCYSLLASRYSIWSRSAFVFCYLLKNCLFNFYCPVIPPPGLFPLSAFSRCFPEYFLCCLYKLILYTCLSSLSVLPYFPVSQLVQLCVYPPLLYIFLIFHQAPDLPFMSAIEFTIIEADGAIGTALAMSRRSRL